MEYVIEKISQEEPREWGEGEKKTFYIKVKLTGVDKAVSIGKKDPHALKVGDKVYGTITETEYETNKFTADKPAFGGGGKSFQPKDEAAIKSMWAIGQAVAVLNNAAKPSELLDLTELEALASDLFGLVDKVKESGGSAVKTAVDAPKRDWASVGKEDVPEPPDFLQPEGF